MYWVHNTFIHVCTENNRAHYILTTLWRHTCVRTVLANHCDMTPEIPGTVGTYSKCETTMYKSSRTHTHGEEFLNESSQHRLAPPERVNKQEMSNHSTSVRTPPMTSPSLSIRSCSSRCRSFSSAIARSIFVNDSWNHRHNVSAWWRRQRHDNRPWAWHTNMSHIVVWWQCGSAYNNGVRTPCAQTHNYFSVDLYTNHKVFNPPKI